MNRSQESRLPPVSPWDLEPLPRYALPAFAGRCARRVEPLIRLFWQDAPGDAIGKAERAIIAAEEYAQGSGAPSDPEGHPMLVAMLASNTYDFAKVFGSNRVFGRFQDERTEKVATSAIEAAANAAWCAAATAPGPRFERPRSGQAAHWNLGRSAHESAAIASLYAVKAAEYAEDVWSAVRRDMELLKDAARESKWTDKTRVPPRFFTLRSTFDTQLRLDRRTIDDVISTMNMQRMLELRADPARLFELSPRDFEHLIRELFSEFGFDVELTKRTRDGGIDIVAVRHRTYLQKYLIEVKLYRADRKVGVEVVRALHGVAEDAGATNAVLVTTSGFTSKAAEYIERNRWLLEGRDFEDIVQWLQDYERSKLEEVLEPWSDWSPEEAT